MKANETFAFIQEIATDLSRGSVVFPTSFDTTMKLRDLLRSDDCSLQRLAAIVSLDPLLASKVVQAANSVVNNPSGATITTVPYALQRIGVNAVRMMALALTMQQLLTYKHMARYDRLCDGIMRHSRFVAAAAFVIAREHTRISPDQAIFAGLVHDIGLFYLVYRIAGRSDLDLDDAETLRLMCDWHASIGHAVLSALGIPDEILAAVDNHDEPRPVEAIRDLGDLLFVCNQMSRHVDQAGAGLEQLYGEEASGMIRDFPAYLTTIRDRQDELRAIVEMF